VRALTADLSKAGQPYRGLNLRYSTAHRADRVIVPFVEYVHSLLVKCRFIAKRGSRLTPPSVFSSLFRGESGASVHATLQRDKEVHALSNAHRSRYIPLHGLEAREALTLDAVAVSLGVLVVGGVVLALSHCARVWKGGVIESICGAL